jgi:N-acetylglucosamine malate deacetylase 1
MTPYHRFVSETARALRESKNLPYGGFASVAPAQAPASAPEALIFSPHPDDEAIIGALALRLMREAGWKISNVAVTQGSAPARQAGRWTELKAACGYLGFDLVATAPNGLEKVTPKARAEDSQLWSGHVAVIARILRERQPRAVFVPHEQDWNGTHIGTHLLVRDAMESLGTNFQTHVVETEYWGQMTAPNLMVEVSEPQLGDQVAAVSFHAGEVRRNPFHVLLPAWMADNVRRGSELVGGQGGAAPDFTFATLYRTRLWSRGRFEDSKVGRNLAVSANPAALFPEFISAA